MILSLGGWRLSQHNDGAYTEAEKDGHPFTNRLIREKSPYLLQHAHNPVDWYPWGEDAFQKAKRENKPIFISIGYSTCHWCHVMERESFENEVIAKLMNEDFVCVKVDREERPDVDQIYMNAVMALSGQGGWPLNLFLTPDLKPFYGGTYFSPDERYGRPGFPSILMDVAKIWKTKPEEVEKAGKQLADLVAQSLSHSSAGDLKETYIQEALKGYQEMFDERDGGFGGAPKFPRAMTLGFLLREYRKTQDPAILTIVTVTLDKMLQGGIYDQVGGGFARYSTDDRWLVPHFEKMLYDNALLARAYLEGYQVTGNGEYARAAREIFSYLLRDMTDKEGGFYSAQDADSEGEEGKFYVWKPAELKAVLGDKDSSAFIQLYGVTERGNFEGNANILHLKTDLPKALKDLGRDEKWWSETKEKIHLARDQRVHPHLDDKILTAWNGLMISSLAYGYQVLGEREYLKAAERASAFIQKNLIKKGRLMASFRQGPSEAEGFIDDYAFYQMAQLDLFESTFDTTYLKEAIRLSEEMIRLFWDKQEGGFYFTGSDQKDRERLLARQKEAYDGAIPSGNSIAALNFFRLAELTGDQRNKAMGEDILSAFSGLLEKNGSNYPQMLEAYQFILDGPAEILLVGPREHSEKTLQLLWKTFLPNKVLVFAEDGQLKGLTTFIPWVEGRNSQDGKPTVYFCRNYQCQLPTTDENKVLELISAKK